MDRNAELGLEWTEEMSATAKKRLLVRRPRRISTDLRGRSEWADAPETAQLELVSTQMLKVILTSRDDSDRRAIEHAADTAAEGVLARDPASGDFEIIDDEELQAILDTNQGLPSLSRPADATIEPLRDYVDEEHLSLVSTHALRKVLHQDAQDERDSTADLPEPVGFDPYTAG